MASRTTGKQLVSCPGCSRVIRIKGRYHSGFGNQGFLYCDKDSTVLLFDTYNRYYAKLIPNKYPWTLTSSEKGVIEDHLKPCPYGGTFRFANKPRCPYCKNELTKLVDKIYYVILNKTVNGNKKSAWR